MKEQISAVIIDGNMNPAIAQRFLSELTKHLMNHRLREVHVPGLENEGVEVHIRKSPIPCRMGMVLGGEFAAAVNDGITELTIHYFVPCWPDRETNFFGAWLKSTDPALGQVPEFLGQEN